MAVEQIKSEGIPGRGEPMRRPSMDMDVARSAGRPAGIGLTRTATRTTEDLLCYGVDAMQRQRRPRDRAPAAY